MRICQEWIDVREVRRKRTCGIRNLDVRPSQAVRRFKTGCAKNRLVRAALQTQEKDAWSEDRRGANKKLRMPGSRDRLHLRHLDAALDGNKQDESGGDNHWNCRVHADTERAMIGISIDRVCVRYLGNGQQSQQNQTHKGDRRQSRKLCASIPFPMCLKCCQNDCPHLKNTQV
jgi:hypothetical protein